MAERLIQTQTLTAIADAIRAKNGSSNTYTPAQMAAAIGAITTGDSIDHEDLPAYVKAEALAVAERVKAKLQSDSIVILTASDSHQIESGNDAANTMAGNLHAGQALKALAYMLPVDFAAYLGDYTAGSSTTGIQEGLGHIAAVNGYIDEAFRGLVQFRTVGNHDPLGYSYSQNGETLSQAQLYALIGKYNADCGNVMGSTVAGYCYRDFAGKSLRVICLNTADVAAPTGGAEAVSDAQKKWFADTLISTHQGYGILILSHHPLDWGNIMSVSHILRAYVEEQSSINIGGTTYSFTGKNKSAWVLQIHGHVHTFTVDNLRWNNGGTGVAYDVKRVALPCTNFVRTNEYGTNGSAEYYGIEFGTPGDTQSKVAGTAKDTAFCVCVINPSEQKVYAINYGAGYDREVYWGENVVAVTGITLNEDSGTLNPGGTTTLTATVTPADASNKGVTWTSSNTDVATVANGVVTAVSVGSATITATTMDGGFTATYALTVEAVKRGNLIGQIGYQDNVRISTSNGADRTGATGYVTVEYFDIDAMIDSYPAVIRIKGADFRSSTHSNSAHCAYTTSKGFNSANYNDGGNPCAALNNASWTYAFDSDGNMTWTCPRRPSATIGFIRICGYGSGANLDLRINENFD